MELLTPGIGLLLWQILIAVVAILFVVSWTIILKTETLDSRDRLSWLLGTFFLPLIGPITFLAKFLRSRRTNDNE